MYSCDARVILSVLIGLFLSCNVFAQDITIKGNVKDAKGEPIIGASILEKGTTNGTVTDFDGNFMLSAPKGSTIGISYIGYKSQDIINQGQSNLIVVLQEDTEVLDEIVVIGYGTVKKDDATGSVTAIKPDKMNRGLTTTATDMINGKIAGVNITTDGGAPGSGASIRIRGGSSLSASNNPLIVIDGLPIDNDGIKGVSNPLSTINPNDIATFTVLKDASATAIYGSRASNGVILITTKKGEKGSRPRVTYDGNVSISTKTKSIDVMGADEYRNFVTDRFGAESSAVKLLGKENTDWQKEIFRTAVGTDHNITVSGGLNNMPYRVSVGYTNQNGILKTSKFERYTGSVNLAPSFFEDHLNINFNAKGMISNNRFADTGAIGAAIAFDPTQPVMNGNSKYGGYFAWENAGEFISIATKNPVAMLQQKKEEANSKNLVGNIQVDYKFHFLPELRANLNLGMDMATGTQDIYYPKESPLGYVDNGKTGYETIDKYNHLLDFYLQYAKDFKIFWDNAYCIHHLSDTPDKLLNILDECEKAGNPDRVYMLASTSKVTFPGAGVAMIASSEKNIKYLKSMMTVQTIGYDKINQLRHVKFFGTYENLMEHMKKHRAIIEPKFKIVLDTLEKEIAPLGIGSWEKPNGGYFISFNALNGCAKRICQLCKEAGVVLTGAGATYPYGKDPDDSNIRIAPTFPPENELKVAADVFATAVKLASAEKLLAE